MQGVWLVSSAVAMEWRKIQRPMRHYLCGGTLFIKNYILKGVWKCNSSFYFQINFWKFWFLYVSVLEALDWKTSSENKKNGSGVSNLKCFFPEILVKPNVLKYLSVIFEIVAFLTHIRRGICSQVPTLCLDKLFPHLNCLLNKRKRWQSIAG